MKVLVLSGGRSAEREISLLSAKWVSGELRRAGHTVIDLIIQKNGRWVIDGSSEETSFETGPVPWKIFSGNSEKTQIHFDVVFPVLHGSYGEDGTVQGLCATAGWPCTGVPVMGSSVAMEKHTLKKLAQNESLPVVPWVFIDENENTSLEILREHIDLLGFPVFVKPSRLGSSVGISRAENHEELSVAVQTASEFDHLILIEKAVDSPREIEVSVIGNGNRIFSSLPGEVLPGKEWYNYEAKYHCEDSKLAVPADLSASVTEDIRIMAEKAFALLGGRGFSRVDFLMNSEGIWLNEINTIPGFTSISMFPKLWAASGMKSDELLNFILEETLSRDEHGLEVK